ncbi:hypothetical protein M0657_001631 [Pyricularia oryzae]|nr:hypothetical protein M9X92_001018 [Pyricularia oryzae]KAI7930511.1 hypothetical protein M0657_001631 [Pyricularia oryzae]
MFSKAYGNPSTDVAELATTIRLTASPVVEVDQPISTRSLNTQVPFADSYHRGLGEPVEGILTPWSRGSFGLVFACDDTVVHNAARPTPPSILMLAMHTRRRSEVRGLGGMTAIIPNNREICPATFGNSGQRGSIAVFSTCAVFRPG